MMMMAEAQHSRMFFFQTRERKVKKLIDSSKKELILSTSAPKKINRDNGRLYRVCHGFSVTKPDDFFRVDFNHF